MTASFPLWMLIRLRGLAPQPLSVFSYDDSPFFFFFLELFPSACDLESSA